MKKLTTTLVILTTLNGCASYQAMQQPSPADLEGVGPGASRQVLINKLGAPKLTDNAADGKKQDIFEFQSGYSPVSKLRVIPYLAADVFSAFLSELVFWPLELTAMSAATCTGVATYDANYKVSTWAVKKKDDNSAQGC